MARQEKPSDEQALNWVQALGEEHARLGSFLSRLGAALLPEREPTVEQLLPLLHEVATHCRRHMEYEERDGYLSGILERYPNLSHRLDELRGEHRTLQSELAECLAAVGEHSGIVPQSTMVRLRKWLDALRDHEIRENTLVQEVFNTDIGTGD